MFISEITEPLPKGMTTHPSKLNTKVIIGADKNKVILALLGSIVSFAKSLSPSAKG
jgi:hypothetical protein